MDNEAESTIAFTHLCSTLDYQESSGLVTLDSNVLDASKKFIFDYAKEKLNVDAIFFYTPETGPSIPYIYFKKLKSEDQYRIAELHKLVWNMGQAPLLFIVLPTKVLIYNANIPPKIVDDKLDTTAGFIEELNLFLKVDTEIQKISKYHSSELLTGRFWQKNSDKFDRKNKVNETLLENLECIRRKLLKTGLSNEIIHCLINRAIFIKYLEDRKDTNGKSVFPKDFFKKYQNSAEGFVDVLSDKRATYSLFEGLNKKFNGDIFFVDNEQKIVTQQHLNLIQEMLKGEMYLSSGQKTLWPLYSFDVIPIELISNIYQRFVHVDDANIEKNGTHYTPYHLAAFLIDQVLPWNGPNSDVKILDPSCGSGIFLVESYRRLIYRWKTNNDKKPEISDLNNILKENIFGVDINEKAIRIAALSLYLTLCDYLDPRDIWENLKFEPLIGKNLFKSDFFEKSAPFLNKKYDLILGNPPWESKISKFASQYLNENKKPIGDYQICQAFLWRVSDLCKPDGEICMIVSSKSLLFNRSKPNKDFRRLFFSSNNVKTIINFSILRKSLFSQAVGPSAAIIFSPEGEKSQHIFYCTPKPSYSPQDDWLFIIEPQDNADIPYTEAIENDIIWKVAMWGTPRDYELIKRLSQYPTLNEICQKNEWVSGEGFILGKKDLKEAPWLFNKPLVDGKNLEPYFMNEKNLPINTNKFYNRNRVKTKQIFDAPHLLIKQSPSKGLIATFFKDYVVFSQSILGIHCKDEDVNKLINCCIALNTDLSLYFEMLTSGRWLVERDELEKDEIFQIPIPIQNEEIRQLNIEFLKELASNPRKNAILKNFMKKWYNLSESELIQINDTINITLDYFKRKGNSIALKPVNRNILEKYANTYCNLLNNSFSSRKTFQIEHIYAGDEPLNVVSIKFGEGSDIFSNDSPNEELKAVLKKLNEHLIEEISKSIFIRRNLRRYSKNTIFIVKPNQIRFWTASSALRDADETYNEIMSFLGDN